MTDSRMASDLRTMSELDYVLASFAERFEAWRGKRIVLHGTREYARAIIETFDDVFRFAAVATCESTLEASFAGKPIWSAQRLIEEKPDLVILTERVRHAEHAYRSIEQGCRMWGIAIYDMYGLDWIEAMDAIESQTYQSLNGWAAITAPYDVVSFELPVCAMMDNPSAGGCALVPQPRTKRLIEYLLERGQQVIYIGRAPYSAQEQLESLQASELLPEGVRAEDVFYMRAGEDGAWRTIRARFPYERILHIGYGIPKECILPRYYGADTYRMCLFAEAHVPAGEAFEPQLAQSIDAGRLQHALDAAIDAADVVSFDVFDTLIMRTTLRPNDVFELVEQRTSTLGSPLPGFAKARIAAQSRPRALTIYDIYRVLQDELELTDDERDRLLELELQVESEVTIPRGSVCRLMRTAIASGKRVFLTSDMYLPASILKGLLAKAGIEGYEKLLVSCDAKRTKRQGLLDDLLGINIAAERVVHLGNSLADDIAPAEELGMQAILIPSAFDLALAYGFGSHIEGALSLDTRCALGASIATQFEDPLVYRPLAPMNGVACDTVDLKGLVQLAASFNPPKAFAERGMAHLAAPDTRMPVELRQALLRWYPFKPSDRALLLSADREAFLPLVRERFRTVDTELMPNSRYDAIILLDPLEPTARLRALLARLFDALTPQGLLLVGHRNRFGMKYLCGSIDDIVQVPFSMLDANRDSAPLMSIGEMQNLLVDTGFTCEHTYGVLHDQFFAQAIYTDEYLPASGIHDRVLAYDAHQSPLLGVQADMHEGIAQSGMLVRTANYLLQECRKKPAGDCEPHVIGATLSLDRGKEHSFITALFSDGTALKRPAHPEGVIALEQTYAHAEELRKRGISVIDQQLMPDGLHMPLVTDQPLLAYLDSLLPNNAAGFISTFDLLYGDILRSSESTEISEQEALDQWGVSAARLGPVLRRGFIDMVPYNAFWKDGQLIFFDQEFVREQCPAKYILFRALHYTWVHLPHAEGTVRLERMQERYGLSGLWYAFAEVEKTFVEENRNMSAYRDVYEWTGFNRSAIDRRRRMLLDSREALGAHAPRGISADPSTAGAGASCAKADAAKPYRIGLLMGVFDLFHVGHLRLIKRAKERCSYLRVGVLSDELVRHFKGIDPTIPQNQRIEILAAIADVDEVVPIDDTPSRIVEWKRRPFDCFFSGDDYAGNESWAQEKVELEKLGATIEFFPYTKEQSSTLIRGKLG